MSYRYGAYSNNQQYCKEFIDGLKQLKDYSIQNALRSFQLAYQSVSSNDPNHNKYASYCGLLRVLSGDRDGIELCRNAVRSEHHDGDVFLNLACVEWHVRSRRQSVLAVEKGLKVERKHAGLKRMRNQIGYRDRNVIPFLARNNPLNKIFGMLKRRKAVNDTQWGLPHVF